MTVSLGERNGQSPSPEPAALAIGVSSGCGITVPRWHPLHWPLQLLKSGHKQVDLSRLPKAVPRVPGSPPPADVELAPVPLREFVHPTSNPDPELPAKSSPPSTTGSPSHPPSLAMAHHQSQSPPRALGAMAGSKAFGWLRSPARAVLRRQWREGNPETVAHHANGSLPLAARRSRGRILCSHGHFSRSPNNGQLATNALHRDLRVGAL